MRRNEGSWEPHRGLCAIPESGIKRKKGTLETQCVFFTMGGLGGPAGQFNGSLIKVKDWGESVTWEYF